jgi:hypothetical protein
MHTPDPVATFKSVGPRAEANLQRAVETIVAANPAVKLVIATVPDIRELPEFSEPLRAGELSRAWADAATATISHYNARIRFLALRKPRVALLDFDLSTRICDRLYPESVAIADHVISRTGASDDPDHLFLGDVRHLGTVGQGLFAELFVSAIDARFRAGVPALSHREVLKFASTNNPHTLANAKPDHSRELKKSSQTTPLKDAFAILTSGR